MLEKRTKLVFYILLSFLSIFPFLIVSNTAESEAKIINDNSIGYFQTNTCDITFTDVLIKNYKNEDVVYKFNNYTGIDCYGKITGLDKVNNKFFIYIGMNNILNFIHQSLLWVMIFAFYSKQNIFKRNLSFRILIIPIFFIFQFIGEKEFYSSIGSNYSDVVNTSNYFLLSIATAYLILVILLNGLIPDNLSNLIYFLPFTFLLNGTYLGMNMNIYIILVCVIGIQKVTNYKNLNLFFILFSILWIFNFEEKNMFFDVDKIRGFINSSTSLNSFMFWLIIIFLFFIGIYRIFFEKLNTINFDKLILNSLISGTLICFFGYISTIHSSLNLFSYYYFGLNKQAMKTLSSVEGNAWRGLSPSAELIGEYFAFTLLIFIINKIHKQQKISIYEVGMVLVNIYGLYRSNNRAATSMLFAIITIYLINILIPKYRSVLFFLIFIVLITSLIFIFEYDYETGSQLLIAESVRGSNIDIPYDQATGVDKFFLESDYLTLINYKNNLERLTTTQINIIESFVSENNINFIPHPISLVSISSVFINRTIKWGDFMSRYNPDLEKLLFGYGPQQLSDYHNGHLGGSFKDGLYLPHSSLLVFIIFYGITGLILFTIWISKRNNLFDSPFNSGIIFLFFIINLLKSDSLLYINSFFLFFFAISLYKGRTTSEVNELEYQHE